MVIWRKTPLLLFLLLSVASAEVFFEEHFDGTLQSSYFVLISLVAFASMNDLESSSKRDLLLSWSYSTIISPSNLSLSLFLFVMSLDPLNFTMGPMWWYSGPFILNLDISSNFTSKGVTFSIRLCTWLIFGLILLITLSSLWTIWRWDELLMKCSKRKSHSRGWDLRWTVQIITT